MTCVARVSTPGKQPASLPVMTRATTTLAESATASEPSMPYDKPPTEVVLVMLDFIFISLGWTRGGVL